MVNPLNLGIHLLASHLGNLLYLHHLISVGGIRVHLGLTTRLLLRAIRFEDLLDLLAMLARDPLIHLFVQLFHLLLEELKALLVAIQFGNLDKATHFPAQLWRQGFKDCIIHHQRATNASYWIVVFLLLGDLLLQPFIGLGAGPPDGALHLLRLILLTKIRLPKRSLLLEGLHRASIRESFLLHRAAEDHLGDITL